MRIRHNLLIVSLMLLMSCALLPNGNSRQDPTPPPVVDSTSSKPPDPAKSGEPRLTGIAANEYLQQAAAEIKQGAVGSAIQTLRSAIIQHPENKDLRAALDTANKTYSQKKEELDDRLLVVRTQALLQEVRLKKYRKQLDPTDDWVRTDLGQMQKSIADMLPGLKTCAKRQSQLRLDLAKNCAALVLSMEEDNTVRRLLSDIETWETKQATREIKKKEVIQINEANTSVRHARYLVDQGDHFKALQLLEQVLADEPGQLEAQELLFETQGYLERQTGILLNAGDIFYREGRIESAMNSWRAALNINPELNLAREKLQRAQKVLDNLQLLREEKTVSETKPKSNGN